MSFCVSMGGRFTAVSSYSFKIIVCSWIFSCNTSIEPRHELLVFCWKVLSCSVLPHHISDSCSLSYSQMFYMAVCIFISCLYLSNDRQNIYRLDIVNLQCRIADGIRCGCLYLTVTGLGSLLLGFADRQIISTGAGCEHCDGRRKNHKFTSEWIKMNSAHSVTHAFRALVLPKNGAFKRVRDQGTPGDCSNWCLSRGGSRANLPVYPYTA